MVCRVHAKHIGHSLFGDDAYGGAAGSAVSALGRGKSLRYAPVSVICLFLFSSIRVPWQKPTICICCLFVSVLIEQ